MATKILICIIFTVIKRRKCTLNTDNSKDTPKRERGRPHTFRLRWINNSYGCAARESPPRDDLPGSSTPPWRGGGRGRWRHEKTGKMKGRTTDPLLPNIHPRKTRALWSFHISSDDGDVVVLTPEATFVRNRRRATRVRGRGSRRFLLRRRCCSSSRTCRWPSSCPTWWTSSCQTWWTPSCPTWWTPPPSRTSRTRGGRSMAPTTRRRTSSTTTVPCWGARRVGSAGWE